MVLLRFEKPVVHRQIHINDHDIGHRRGSLTLAEGLGHCFGVGRPALVKQEPQRLIHAAFSLLRGQEEDRQVILDHAAGPLVLQEVVSHPEPAGGEHRIAVAVLLERPGLAYQPVNDVAVLDAMLTPASESRQGVDLSGPVPDVECFGTDMNIHLFADQTAGQRVGVAADMDRAPGIDPGLESPSHLQPTSRQGRQHGHFLMKTLLSVGIASGHELLEEQLIVASAGEITAPAQHQSLVDGLFETVMTLLDVAILVGLSRLDRLAFEPVMREQSLVSSSERLGFGVAVDRGGQAIGAVPSGNSSQFPQGVLQALAEALEALGEADGASLPVGVGQHEVIDHVVERFAEDGDAELGHAGKVRLGEPTRLMDLGEEDLLGRPFEGAPPFDPALQATKLDIGEAAREASLQVEEEGFGLEPRVDPEQFEEFGPDILERVLPGPPGVGDSPLAGERVGVAVLTCRLLVNAGLVGSLSQCVFGLDQLPQPPEQTIGDHPYAPVSREPKWDSLPGSGAGNSNDRWPGKIIVAGQLPAVSQ
jgi:hypothetical protein